MWKIHRMLSKFRFNHCDYLKLCFKYHVDKGKCESQTYCKLAKGCLLFTLSQKSLSHRRKVCCNWMFLIFDLITVFILTHTLLTRLNRCRHINTLTAAVVPFGLWSALHRKLTDRGPKSKHLSANISSSGFLPTIISCSAVIFVSIWAKKKKKIMIVVSAALSFLLNTLQHVC